MRRKVVIPGFPSEPVSIDLPPISHCREEFVGSLSAGVSEPEQDPLTLSLTDPKVNCCHWLCLET